MSLWQPVYGEPSRIEIRGKPIFNENTRKVSLPVTVGGREFVWEMTAARFKELQQVNGHYDLDSGRYDLEVSYEDAQRRRLRVIAIPRFVVIWTDQDGASGELFDTYPDEATAVKALPRNTGVTYEIREAS